MLLYNYYFNTFNRHFSLSYQLIQRRHALGEALHKAPEPWLLAKASHSQCHKLVPVFWTMPLQLDAVLLKVMHQLLH